MRLLLSHTTFEPHYFVIRALSWMRWTTIAAVLALVLLQPAQEHSSVPGWILISLFALYGLLGDLLHRRLPWSRFSLWQAVMDLGMIGGIYAMRSQPGGPFFLLFFVAIACAAATLPTGLSFLYTVLVVGTVAILELLFITPSLILIQSYQLGARLTALGVLGIGMSILVRGLILQQEAAQAARNEAQRLSKLDEMREEFVATISHDLRTPLTAARASIGMLSLSAAAQLRTDEVDLLENARRNIERLHLLIDDLLAFNQLAAGTLDLERQPMDLAAVVRSALVTVQPLLRQKAQVLDVQLPQALPIDGDLRRLEQVVINLLANAHQHTPSGTRIRVMGTLNSHEACLAISDNGPGISPDELEAVFRRYYRVSPTTEGSGLGLAIAKRLVELHGGRLWVESQLGQGTSFTVALPRSASMLRESMFREKDET